MKRLLFTSLLSVIIPLCGANAATTTSPLDELSVQAVSANETESTAAIAILRDSGPSGLEALFRTHAAVIQRKRATPSLHDADWQRVSAALDAVARQHDSWASGLYWFTDFDLARSESRSTGKPILSLRLLGNLDEEFSCANSRFFRTVLYPNGEVAGWLRDHFVLYWKSVRPVPRVTIDFGDGRVLQRTITGNSIHYVLDSEGRVVDALPGLYGPKAFLAALEPAYTAAVQSARLDAGSRDKFLREYHANRLAELERSSRADATSVSDTSADPAQWTDVVWKKVAALHKEDEPLDPASAAVIRENLPNADDANRITVSKMRVESPLLRAVNGLVSSMAEDSVRNEYLLHRTIHEWFTKGVAPANLENLNERVYAQLFLSPLSDPWYGLAPTDAYSAIESGGTKFVNK